MSAQEHAAPPASHPAHADFHRPNVRAYMFVFTSLLVLTIVTVLVSWLDLPVVAAVFVAMAIATLKASLVLTFFMHLKGERVFVYGILGITVLFAIFLYSFPVSDAHVLGPISVHTNAAAESEGHHVSPARS